MRNSLQDQLLKAGLVNDKTIKAANKQKHKDKKRAGGKDLAAEEQRRNAEQAIRDKAERDRQLAAERNAEARSQELVAQVAQLINHYKQPRGGDVAYNFADNGKIKKIWVNEKLQGQLVRGQLAIVRFNDGYELVPAVAAERIQGRLDDVVLVLNKPSDDVPDEDDPYKDFPIPDDLMW